jgi:hypothetical protein
MKKIIIALMLTILNTPTFAEPQSTQQPAAPTQSTTQTQTFKNARNTKGINA